MKIWQIWLTHCCTWMPMDNHSKWKLRTSTIAPSHGDITPTFLIHPYQKAVSGQCHGMAILPQGNSWMGPQPVWMWQWREKPPPRMKPQFSGCPAHSLHWPNYPVHEATSMQPDIHHITWTAQVKRRNEPFWTLPQPTFHIFHWVTCLLFQCAP